MPGQQTKDCPSCCGNHVSRLLEGPGHPSTALGWVVQGLPICLTPCSPASSAAFPPDPGRHPVPSVTAPLCWKAWQGGWGWARNPENMGVMRPGWQLQDPARPEPLLSDLEWRRQERELVAQLGLLLGVQKAGSSLSPRSTGRAHSLWVTGLRPSSPGPILVYTTACGVTKQPRGSSSTFIRPSVSGFLQNS